MGNKDYKLPHLVIKITLEFLQAAHLLNCYP